VVCFFEESTTQAVRRSGRSGKREAGRGKRERQNQRREMSIGVSANVDRAPKSKLKS
jgi:hypothetical protein